MRFGIDQRLFQHLNQMHQTGRIRLQEHFLASFTSGDRRFLVQLFLVFVHHFAVQVQLHRNHRSGLPVKGPGRHLGFQSPLEVTKVQLVVRGLLEDGFHQGAFAADELPQDCDLLRGEVERAQRPEVLLGDVKLGTVDQQADQRFDAGFYRVEGCFEVFWNTYFLYLYFF